MLRPAYKPHKPSKKARLAPVEVLYEFDGPQLFVAEFGFLEAIFVRIDEDETNLLWLAAVTNSELVGSIREGSVSVRAAFVDSEPWIVETDINMWIGQFWKISRDDLTEDMLPAKGEGLYGQKQYLPDTLIQRDSFFSMYFQGERLRNYIMPFSVFKGLMESVYEISRRALGPEYLAGSRSGIFDFNIFQPAFGSLIVAIENPILHIDAISRKYGEETDFDAIDKQFESQRNLFFDEMKDLVSRVEKGSMTTGAVADSFALVDMIQHVIPREDNDIESITFGSNRSRGPARVHISKKAGIAMQHAFREAELRPITEVGIIRIINSPQSSFVMMSTRGKQVTCYIATEIFAEISRDQSFRTGSRIRVFGKLKRRPVRDQLYVEGYPTMMR